MVLKLSIWTLIISSNSGGMDGGTGGGGYSNGDGYGGQGQEMIYVSWKWSLNIAI